MLAPILSNEQVDGRCSERMVVREQVPAIGEKLSMYVLQTYSVQLEIDPVAI